ncbi:MAG: coiled-coil domain-containing protein [Candidatus Odinarchaeota archaeon]
MVFKNINRIQAALPEVIHIAMFYNNGTIFQTTFEQDINIPKLGDSLAKVLKNIRNIYQICNFTTNDYKKIIFETEDVSIIILKLGEESNLALFFRSEEGKDLNLTPIKRYLTRIEELIDMDKKELILHEILSKEEESKELQIQLLKKDQELKELQEKSDKETSEEEAKKFKKELSDLNEEYNKIKETIENLDSEIKLLKEEIEKSHQ